MAGTEKRDGKEKGTFKYEELHGEGEVITYDENGNKKREWKGNFRGGRLEGEGYVVSYDENGNKYAEARGKYEDGRLRDGELIFHDDNTLFDFIN